MRKPIRIEVKHEDGYLAVYEVVRIDINEPVVIRSINGVLSITPRRAAA